MNTILVVDDEPNYLIVLSELLIEEGFEVVTADRGDKALKILNATDIDLVITDMRMPGMDGMKLLKSIKAINMDLPVIMLTAFGEVEMAVGAMQAGANNYLTKPFKNNELVLCVKKGLDHYSLLRENRRLRNDARDRYHFGNMIGKNKLMQHVYSLIKKMAPTSSSVLITGESGTGKELVAKAIHFNSPREKAPLISLNCAGLPPSLLESELFGHEKGAFTSAVSLRKGRFEIADTGTLFLDEIGEMALHLQVKLLRVLQERSFERVGGSKSLKVDIRIVAATNKDLKEEVEKGNFREDLYYRLDVLHIHLPPLRERMDDIPLLVGHFLKKNRTRLDLPDLEISPNALRVLTTLPWEGNVRELENTIERAAILCTGNRIEPEDVAGPDTPGLHKAAQWNVDFDPEGLFPAGTPLPEIMNGIEKKLVKEAMKNAGHVQTRAAETLGITKSLLQYKIKKFRLPKK
ncbi:MAG: sigma-54-dependent Fis family transcriptional regulator [Desulfobulbaceae bacterium]|nr:sigma-54-dependent Fis family transcriptional regulator [Desulfobulbaceae bacterium]